jgi:hypothetical protein
MIFSSRKMQNGVLWLVICLLTAPNVMWSLAHNKELLQKDTRLAARDWIEKNIPPGSHLLVEGVLTRGFIELNEIEGRGARGFLPLHENGASLHRNFLLYEKIIDNIPDYRGIASQQLKIRMENVEEPSYRIDYFYTPRKFKKRFLHYYLNDLLRRRVLAIDEYREMGIDYVVVTGRKSSYDYSSERVGEEYLDFYSFFRSLEKDCRLIKTFRYENSKAEREETMEVNPEIRIYRLESEHGQVADD